LDDAKLCHFEEINVLIPLSSNIPKEYTQRKSIDVTAKKMRDKSLKQCVILLLSLRLSRLR